MRKNSASSKKDSSSCKKIAVHAKNSSYFENGKHGVFTDLAGYIIANVVVAMAMLSHSVVIDLAGYMIAYVVVHGNVVTCFITSYRRIGHTNLQRHHNH